MGQPSGCGAGEFQSQPLGCGAGEGIEGSHDMIKFHTFKLIHIGFF